MTRNVLVAILVLAGALAQAVPAAADGKAPEQRPVLSMTIDFLDYVFFDNIGTNEYYDLASYERRIREMAELGVKKISLRVNVCGLTLYPSTVSKQYGKDDELHWDNLNGARRLVRTLEKYDPCVETIRIAHKYGLEAWAWENLWDFSGGGCPDPANKFAQVRQRKRNQCLADNFYIEHPEHQAMRRPDDKRGPLHFEGIPEYCDEAAMKHQLARFEELAKYPFDGFVLSPRTHSKADDKTGEAQFDYCYNPAVLSRYAAKYGHALPAEGDVPGLMTVRGEAVADFIRDCKRILGNRRLYLDGLEPIEPGRRAGTGSVCDAAVCHMNGMPMLYARYFADKSVDGVRMIGRPHFYDRLRAIPGAEKITIGVFRDNNQWNRKYDFAQDTMQLSRDGRLAEVELYEMLVYTNLKVWQKYLLEYKAKH